jgi:hypothetical protein
MNDNVSEALFKLINLLKCVIQIRYRLIGAKQLRKWYIPEFSVRMTFLQFR